MDVCPFATCQHEALAGQRHAVGTLQLQLIQAQGLVYQGLGLPAPYVKVPPTPPPLHTLTIATTPRVNVPITRCSHKQ